MEELELTWGRLLKVYWAAFWKGTAGILVVVIPLVALEIREPEFSHRWYAALNLPVSAWAILVWVIALRSALRKTYSDFRVALLPR